MVRRFAIPTVLLAAVLASSCGKSADDVVEVTLIGSSDALFAKGVRLPDAAQHLRAATVDGLVGLDAGGQVVPGLAERWIVTDDGRSYLFRLGERNWPDGSPLTGETVRQALRETLRSLRGTSLDLDFAKISEVRAMTGRVVEIRLVTPMPEFLQLLAQPELGLFRKGKATGEMVFERQNGMAVLTPVPPEQRGLPVEPGWEERARRLRITALPAVGAVTRFANGETDVVLGGRIESLPLADVGPLSRGTVRIDGVLGLFGLQVVAANGFLGDPARREAVAMAIDREEMVAPFNISGWVATTRMVQPGLGGDLGTIGERWSGMSQDKRRAEAARRVATWRKANGAAAVSLSIAMPSGPGMDIVFSRLRADLAKVGLTAKRNGLNQPADFRLVDRAARYADARWFLNQFNCNLRQGLCSPAADARVAEAVKTPDQTAGAALLAEAEAELTATNAYIPIGAPLRWSLVRGNVTGFAPNRLGFHPLPPLAMLPR